MELPDKILLRKRAVIESVNNFLKNICQIEHSRHRSCCNFVVNLVSGIAAYSFLPKKPSTHPWNNAMQDFIIANKNICSVNVMFGKSYCIIIN